MIVTVKNEVNEPEVRLRAPWNEGSRGVHRAAQENETKYFFSSRKFGHISTLPVSPPEDISTRQLAAEVITHRTHRSVRLHASICSPAWELEFISTIAQFLSTLRSVRLHRKPSTVSFDFRLQWERKRIFGSLGQLWNALTSAPGAKNELLNGGLSSRFFFFFLRLYTKLKHDHNRTTIHDFNS